MGNQSSTNIKIGFDDMNYAILKNYVIINTLSLSEQDILIQGTLDATKEYEIINELLKINKSKEIIIYGKNSCDQTVIKKYEQLKSLGFINVYIYMGGLFEWFLLQDIYGDDNFPTTKKNLDILKYKPNKFFDIKFILN
jgi:rhodanese-related sulfurtransferase